MENLKATLIFLTFSCIFITSKASHEMCEDKIMQSDDIVSGEKESAVTLHFYVQDVRSGPETTVFAVASSPAVAADHPTKFAQVNVLDDKITVAPELNSDEIGRVQGLSTSADMQVRAISVTFNFVFTAGEYSGSTFTVVARNQLGDAQRELPVVGGTGAFRRARGYAITTTYLDDEVENRSTLEYWVYLTYSKSRD